MSALTQNMIAVADFDSRPVAGPLGRSAFGGRNWEGFSPDPYLTGEVMSLTITGMQSSGVQVSTCLGICLLV